MASLDQRCSLAACSGPARPAMASRLSSRDAPVWRPAPRCPRGKGGGGSLHPSAGRPSRRAPPIKGRPSTIATRRSDPHRGLHAAVAATPDAAPEHVVLPQRPPAHPAVQPRPIHPVTAPESGAFASLTRNPPLPQPLPPAGALVCAVPKAHSLPGELAPLPLPIRTAKSCPARAARAFEASGGPIVGRA